MKEDDDLRQADLSHLSIKDMTPSERAEMRRRLEHFVRLFGGPPLGATPAKKTVRKWVPGMKK